MKPSKCRASWVNFGSNEGADAMSDGDVSAAGKVGQRLPGGHAADARALGQLTFGGELGPGRERAGPDPPPGIAAASW